MVNREQALTLMNNYIKNTSLRNHCLASESVLRALAKKLGCDEKEVEIWGLAGLLHDLDFEQTEQAPEKHGKITAEILTKENVNPEIIRAVLAHNAENLGLKRESQLDFAITCGETITGLLLAATLVRPEKDIGGLKVKSVVKKMKDKSFARAVNRDAIKLCEQLDIPLNDFVELSIKAMAEIADSIIL